MGSKEEVEKIWLSMAPLLLASHRSFTTIPSRLRHMCWLTWPVCYCMYVVSYVVSYVSFFHLFPLLMACWVDPFGDLWYRHSLSQFPCCRSEPGHAVTDQCQRAAHRMPYVSLLRCPLHPVLCMPQVNIGWHRSRILYSFLCWPGSQATMARFRRKNVRLYVWVTKLWFGWVWLKRRIRIHQNHCYLILQNLLSVHVCQVTRFDVHLF